MIRKGRFEKKRPFFCLCQNNCVSLHEFNTDTTFLFWKRVLFQQIHIILHVLQRRFIIEEYLRTRRYCQGGGCRPESSDLDKIQAGSKVYALGRLQTQKYMGADGVEKTYYEVVASKVNLIESDEPLQYAM